MAISKSKAEERAARVKAAQEAQAKAERKRNLVRGGIAVVVLALLVGVFTIFLTRGGDKVDPVAATSDSSYSLTVGPDTAPHKVVIYEDFLCPFCQQFEAASHEALAAAATAGKVQIEYRPFDFLGGGDKNSYSARSAAAFSVVLDKSGPEIAKKFHDALYVTGTQPSESGPFPDNDALLSTAVTAGADEATVKDGIEGDDGNAWVEGATAFAKTAKISATPTIFLDGKRFQDGNTVADLATNLEQAIAK